MSSFFFWLNPCFLVDWRLLFHSVPPLALLHHMFFHRARLISFRFLDIPGSLRLNSSEEEHVFRYFNMGCDFDTRQRGANQRLDERTPLLALRSSRSSLLVPQSHHPLHGGMSSNHATSCTSLSLISFTILALRTVAQCELALLRVAWTFGKGARAI